MTSSMSTPAVMEDTPTAVKSELLCFVASKSAIMAFDDIVKICASFFREEEIIEARCVLEKVGVSMHKRRGDDKFRSTVEDITKAVLNPGLTLPTFYATDLNRLPPVDIKHQLYWQNFRPCVLKSEICDSCKMKCRHYETRYMSSFRPLKDLINLTLDRARVNHLHIVLWIYR